MGITDYDNLKLIKQWSKEYNLINSTKFDFIIDTDTKEGKTRIMINEVGDCEKRPFLTEKEAHTYRQNGYKMCVPDLMDYERKLIIEYQEEPKGRVGILRRRGKIRKKGHDELSDTMKDEFYALAGFTQLKIWESSTTKKQDLFDFLDLYVTGHLNTNLWKRG